MHQHERLSLPNMQTATVLRECGICQSPIQPADAITPCPKCGLVFHTECWQENLGCASYGCDQVNILGPKELVITSEQPAPPIEQPPEPIPWNFLLLGAATVGLLASALTFGLPSALVEIAVLIRLIRTRRLRQPILLAAGAIAALGIAAGVFVSRLWWLTNSV